MNSAIEILKLLNKSNCGDCGESTCLAFAAAVSRGNTELNACPHVDKNIIERFQPSPPQQAVVEQNLEEPEEELKRRLRAIDFSLAAKRLGAKYSNNRLTVKVCGKDFSVDQEGNFFSEIHIHSWITGPLLSYIIDGAGKIPSGEWISFREIKGSQSWYSFFVHMCEKPLKKVADTYTDLFEDMLHIFNGKRVENHYESDISLVLSPLPRVPILVCYWKPEDGLESSLNLFFDKTVNDNIDIKFVYALGTGLVTMFQKISLRHGFK